MPLYRAIYRYPGGAIRGQTFAALDLERAKTWAASMLPEGVEVLDVHRVTAREGSAEKSIQHRQGELL